MGFITAWDKKGRQVEIPQHWVDIPELIADFVLERPDKVFEDCCGASIDDDETETTDFDDAGEESADEE